MVLRSDNNEDDGVINLLYVLIGALALYMIASAVQYYLLRTGADANHDGKTTEAEYTAYRATSLTGTMNTVLGPGVDFIAAVAPKVWAYDVVTVSP